MGRWSRTGSFRPTPELRDARPLVEQPEIKLNVYPKYDAWIVRKADGERVLDVMPWGIIRNMPGKRPLRQGLSYCLFRQMALTCGLRHMRGERGTSDRSHFCRALLWGMPMSHYRLYFMNPLSGHIDKVAELEAPDDDSAVALASEHVGDRSLELWNEGRKVRRMEGPPDRKISFPAMS